LHLSRQHHRSVSELIGANPINLAARAFLLGYVEGQNLVMEWRSEGRFERFPEIIRSIKADFNVTTVVPTTRAAKAVTRTVPIVMASVANPVEVGLIESLVRPVEPSRGWPESLAMRTLPAQHLAQHAHDKMNPSWRFVVSAPRSLNTSSI